MKVRALPLVVCLIGCAPGVFVDGERLETSAAELVSGPTFAPGYSGRVLANGPVHGSAGIYFDAHDRLFVSSLIDHTVRVIDKNTGAISAIKGFADGVVTPDDVTVASDDTAYFAAFLTGNVGVWRPDGTVGALANIGTGIDGIAVSSTGRLVAARFLTATEVYEIDRTGATPPRLITSDPSLVGMEAQSFGPDGKLYIPLAPSGQVVKLDIDTGVSSVVASGLHEPLALKFNHAGKMVVVENLTGRIVEVNPATGAQKVLGNGGVGIDNLAFDSHDNLYFTNSMGGEVARLDPGGHKKTIVRGGLNAPGGLALARGPSSHGPGSGDHLYVADLSSVRTFTLPGGHEQPLIPGEFAKPTTALALPFTIAPFGDALVTTSWFANTVQVLDKGTGAVTRAYLDFAAPTNAIEYRGDLLVAEIRTGTVSRQRIAAGTRDVVASGLAAPAGLATDGNSVWVADWATGTVSKIMVAGAPIAPVAAVMGLSAPEGITFADGRLLVVETGKNRLISVNPANGDVHVIASNLAPEIPPPPGFPPTWIFSDVKADTHGDLYLSSSGSMSIWQIHSH